MEFDQNNKVVQLCVEGMEMEGQGKLAEAANRFLAAWNIAATDFEKFTAAHYLARHQKNISDKLYWDKTALQHALLNGGDSIKQTLPSLYLNIGKCYEDLHELENAKKNYEAALSFSTYLPNDGYGNMIKAGINKAIERTNQQSYKIKQAGN